MVLQNVAMTIAGSDSSGGAGIQADLRVFNALGVYGCSAITAITAQNPHEVTSVFALPSNEVSLQISTVFKELQVSAVKTGMLFSDDIIRQVAKDLSLHEGIFIVVDPVMISTSNARLIDEKAITTLKEVLLPLATVITPNIAEAEVLSDIKIKSRADVIRAGRLLADSFDAAILIKGGHSNDINAVDILFEKGKKEQEFSLPRLENYLSNHGSGCSLSSAIAANLAKGDELYESIRKAKLWVYEAIENAVQIGKKSYGMWPKYK